MQDIKCEHEFFFNQNMGQPECEKCGLLKSTIDAVEQTGGVRKFRKKPVIISAVQWNGSNVDEIALLGGAREYEQDFIGDDLIIHTLEGNMKAEKGDWIIKGVKGELYPCKDDIFKETYEQIN